MSSGRVYIEVAGDDRRCRDDVVRTVGFEARPTDLVRSLDEVEAEGGGDVPEGIYEALSGSLQLGNFEWRPQSRKAVVIVGDTSPRYSDLRSILSLAANAWRDARIETHALLVQTATGDGEVPGYPELASSGRGELLRTRPGDLARSLRGLLFEPQMREWIHLTFQSARGEQGPR